MSATRSLIHAYPSLLTLHSAFYREHTQEELHVVHKFMSEHTTMWREPFWTLLSEKERLTVVDCVKLRMIPRGGESEDFIASDSTSGSMVIIPFRGVIQARNHQTIKSTRITSSNQQEEHHHQINKKNITRCIGITINQRLDDSPYEFPFAARSFYSTGPMFR